MQTKLVKTRKKGQFGLLFQQMVEVERTQTGGMPSVLRKEEELD